MSKIKLRFELKNAKKDLLDAFREHFFKIMEIKNIHDNYLIATSPDYIYIEIPGENNQVLTDYLKTIARIVIGGV